MARSKSSGRWLQEHHQDIYVKKAKQQGYRSRAVYKLIELQEKDRFLRPGMTVVDLGAAPGSWSEITQKLIGGRGKLIAVDCLPMDAIADVTLIQGDFTEDETLQLLQYELNDSKVDVVLSDMAPNMSGNKAVDQPRAMYLNELALDFAVNYLHLTGTFVTKVFQGEGFDGFLAMLRQNFTQVRVRKPQASRARSPEVYCVAKGFRGL